VAKIYRQRPRLVEKKTGESSSTEAEFVVSRSKQAEDRGKNEGKEEPDGGQGTLSLGVKSGRLLSVNPADGRSCVKGQCLKEGEGGIAPAVRKGSSHF